MINNPPTILGATCANVISQVLEVPNPKKQAPHNEQDLFAHAACIRGSRHLCVRGEPTHYIAVQNSA